MLVLGTDDPGEARAAHPWLDGGRELFRRSVRLPAITGSAACAALLPEPRRDVVRALRASAMMRASALTRSI